MDLTTPACKHPDCVVTLAQRECAGRRGDRTVAYEGHGWRCSRCVDPETGLAPLEFVDAALANENAAALARAWREKYGENLPPSGRPGRKTDNPRTERIAVLLTPDELDRVDAGRGSRSRSDFLRDVITQAIPARPRADTHR